MNIQEAKNSIKDAIATYLNKDVAGMFRIQRSRQRPLMLLGPPGLGKTAIVSQIAAEMNIGFVSYTITHHTRQSAIGLPMISTRLFNGTEYSVTEYTMSEIVASVYDAMEKQGCTEGILFIDEINCVSETLTPAMLDLLQNKRFGPHVIPDGWILVAAGNPPEFNSSARTFDIATMDRIRVIDVEPDTDIWLKYAVNNGIHDAISYYLKIKPQNLLHIERTLGGHYFVTPRAWEDLSVILNEYDRAGIDVDATLISQYIRDPDISSEFAKYLDFHKKYNKDHDISKILETGEQPGLKDSDPEEKMATISVIVGRVNSVASECNDLARLKDVLSENTNSEIIVGNMKKKLTGNITASERRSMIFAIDWMEKHRGKNLLQEACSELDRSVSEFNRYITNCMECFITEFGNGQEPVSLLVGLIGCRDVVMVSEPDGPLYRYNDIILNRRKNRNGIGLSEM